MNAWMVFWTAVLIAGVAVFVVLAVVVSIGGFFDIRDLLRSIETQHGKKGGEDDVPPA